MDKLMTSDTGFPGTTETFDRINEMAKQPTEALALAMGDLTIISGVVDDGTNITDGYVIIDNELLPFEGAATQTNVEIIEIITEAFYDNNTTVELPIYKKRFARPAAGGSYLLEDFKRINKLHNTVSIKTLGTFFVVKGAGVATGANIVWTGQIIDVTRIVENQNRSIIRVTIPNRTKKYIPIVLGINTATYAGVYPVEVNNIMNNQFDILVTKDVDEHFRKEWELNIIE
jgi:hypothetical protein